MLQFFGPRPLVLEHGNNRAVVMPMAGDDVLGTQNRIDGNNVGFWWGCQENGPECAHCYARDGYPVSIAEAQTGLRLWASNRKADDPVAVRLKIESAHETLRRLNRKAEREERARVVFINSQADTFEDTDATVVRRLPGKVALDRGYNYEVAYRFEGGIKWHGPDEIVSLPYWTLDDERREMFATIDECQWLRSCCSQTAESQDVA